MKRLAESSKINRSKIYLKRNKLHQGKILSKMWMNTSNLIILKMTLLI